MRYGIMVVQQAAISADWEKSPGIAGRPQEEPPPPNRLTKLSNAAPHVLSSQED